MTFPDWRFLGGFNFGAAFTSAQHGAYMEAAAFAFIGALCMAYHIHRTAP